MKAICFIISVLFVISIASCTKRAAIIEEETVETEALPDTIMVKSDTTIGINTRQEYFNLYPVSLRNKNLQDSIFKHVFQYISSKGSFHNGVVLISPYSAPTENLEICVEILWESMQIGMISPFGYFKHDGILFIIDECLTELIRVESEKTITFEMTASDYDMIIFDPPLWIVDENGKEPEENYVTMSFD